MSITFTKLFSSITESTVWMESDHTRLVWITMLAMADRHGRVLASIPGLAHRARVPIGSAQDAIKTFLAPDKYSRTETNDGKRVEPIDGGWRLLNHAKYRALRDDEAIRESKRLWAERKRAKETPGTPRDPSAPPVIHVYRRPEDSPVKIPKAKAKPFVPPTLLEVELYSKERCSPVDAKVFWEYFTNGNPPWTDMKGQPVRAWKQKFITWEKKDANGILKMAAPSYPMPKLKN